MTAAEKREEARSLMHSALNNSAGRSQCIRQLIDLLTFTDDPTDSPAQPSDWRDQAVALGMWYVNCPDRATVIREAPQGNWAVHENGEVWLYGYKFAPANNDPVARCKAIDRFLAELGGEVGS